MRRVTHGAPGARSTVGRGYESATGSQVPRIGGGHGSAEYGKPERPA